MNKPITMQELESIMTSKTGIFDAISTDKYSLSLDLVCTGVQFEKITGSNEYLYMVLLINGSEVQINAGIIQEIYVAEDDMIAIEFNNELPDLEISYRE